MWVKGGTIWVLVCKLDVKIMCVTVALVQHNYVGWYSHICEFSPPLYLYHMYSGAACVVFSSHASYIAAVSARFMQLNYGSLDKKVN